MRTATLTRLFPGGPRGEVEATVTVHLANDDVEIDSITLLTEHTASEEEAMEEAVEIAVLGRSYYEFYDACHGVGVKKIEPLLPPRFGDVDEFRAECERRGIPVDERSGK